MNDRDLEQLYQQRRGESQIAALRAVFDAGREAGRAEVPPAPVDDAGAEVRQGFYRMPPDEQPGAAIVAGGTGATTSDMTSAAAAGDAKPAEAAKDEPEHHARKPRGKHA